MNKAELVSALARQNKTSKAAAERRLNALLLCLQRGLRRDRVGSLAGFGTFRVRRRRPHMGTNPQTGRHMRISVSRHVTFKCGKNLKAAL